MKNLTILLIMLFAFGSYLSAAEYYSQTSGLWTNPGGDIWANAATGGALYAAGISPAGGDDVFIQTGHDIQGDASSTSLGQGLGGVEVAVGASLIQDTDQAGIRIETNGFLRVYGYMEMNIIDFKNGVTCKVDGTLIAHGDFDLNGAEITGKGTVTADSYSNPGTVFGVTPALTGGTYGGGPIWDGSVSSDWNTTGNWVDGAVPTSGESAIITSDGTAPIVSTTGAAASSIVINSGAVLTIAVDYDLTVTGNITNNAGTDGLVIVSTSSGSGSLKFGLGTPDATVQRYIDVNAWHLVTPSATPSTANDFYLGAPNTSWLAYFDESAGTNGEYNYMTDENATLNRAQGYSYWIATGQGAQTIEFTGALTGADVTATLTKSSGGWNLLGNPFSSAINWGLVAGGNTTGTAYVWDNGIEGYVYSNGSSPNTLPDNIIPMGQGFFVKANTAGDFIIQESARVHNTASFIKSENSDGGDPTQFVRIDLNDGYYGNTVFVGFPENGTDEFDISGDATKLYSSTENVQFFAVENDNELCINANAPLIEGESKTVSLNLVQVTDGNYTMSFSDLDQLENTTISLEDNITGIVQNIRENPIYTFIASSSDDQSRFLLHFAWSPNDIGEDIEQASNIQVYSYGNEVYIRSTNEAINQNGEVFVYDMMGRELAQQKIVGLELIKLPVNTTNSFVVVKVVKAASTKIQKVYIK